MHHSSLLLAAGIRVFVISLMQSSLQRDINPGSARMRGMQIPGRRDMCVREAIDVQDKAGRERSFCATADTSLNRLGH